MVEDKIRPDYEKLKKYFSFFDPRQPLNRGEHHIEPEKRDLLRKYCKQVGVLSALDELCWFVLASSSIEALSWQQAAIFNPLRAMADDAAPAQKEAAAIQEFFRAHKADQFELSIKAKTIGKSKPLRVMDSGLISLLRTQIEDHASEVLSKAIDLNKPGNPRDYAKYVRAEEAFRVFSFIRGELQTSTRKAYFLAGVVLNLAGNPFTDEEGNSTELAYRDGLISNVRSATRKFTKKART